MVFKKSWDKDHKDMTQSPTCVKSTPLSFMASQIKKSITFHAHQANWLKKWSSNRSAVGIIIIESPQSNTYRRIWVKASELLSKTPTTCIQCNFEVLWLNSHPNRAIQLRQKSSCRQFKSNSFRQFNLV